MAAPTNHAPSERKSEGRTGSRRIFPAQFKLQVLEAYRRDVQCRGNQRATARKFGIHRRQIQKWLQAEPALKATLLRRAPQAAPSPPPYNVGSPESARLPTPPPSVPANVQYSALHVAAPQNPKTTSAIFEPIDLSLRRNTQSQQPINDVKVLNKEPLEEPRKPFKLFRPYLLEDQKVHKSSIIEKPSCEVQTHFSAFVPVHSAHSIVGCTVTPCPTWCLPPPAFSAPLR